MPYTDIKDIRACVRTDWSHGNSKFLPGDVCVVTGASKTEQETRRRFGYAGAVIAVTCSPIDGRIRGFNTAGERKRIFTRYYIKFFNDKKIVGIQSHNLTDYRTLL